MSGLWLVTSCGDCDDDDDDDHGGGDDGYMGVSLSLSLSPANRQRDVY